MAQVGRVLIVGGGIGGLATGAALLLAGFDVVVFEQNHELREAGAGVGLWSNAMSSLDQLGAGHMVRKSCMPLRTLAGSNAHGKTLNLVNLDDLGPEFASAACSVVLRPVLLAALAERVPQSSIRTNARALSIEAMPDRVQLHLHDGRIEEGDLLIGADGLYSIVRPLVAGPDSVRYSGQTCFRGIAQIRPDEPGVMREVQGAGQRGSVCPVDDQTAYWWTALNAPCGAILPPVDRKTFLLERYKGWPYGIEAAIASTPAASILQNDLFDRPPASTYTRRRLVLVGDAAHPTTPNLGQGANMAIDDGIVLARCLRNSPTIEGALQEYQRERLPRTRMVVQRSWSYGRMCVWKSPFAVWLRETSVRLTPGAVLKRMLSEQILESVGTL